MLEMLLITKAPVLGKDEADLEVAEGAAEAEMKRRMMMSQESQERGDNTHTNQAELAEEKRKKNPRLLQLQNLLPRLKLSNQHLQLLNQLQSLHLSLLRRHQSQHQSRSQQW